MLAKFVMLAALLAASVVTENLCSVPDQSSFRSNLQPACLLQNAVFSSDLVDDATDILEVTDQDSFVKRPKSTALFEFDALEESNTGKLLVRSASRSRRCEGYLMYLNRKIYGLEHARNVSNIKMDELIRQFISKQSGSQDACSSQLMEAKHQLNQIHEYVMDLVVQVNTTERAILALDKEMQSKIKEVEALNKWKEDELAICERKKQEYIEMYKKLSIEMQEMKQIASPGVAMDVKTGTVITAEKAVGLVQIKPHQDGKKSMEDLDFLIEGTRSAAKQYMHCMTKASAKAHSSHLQRSVLVDGSEVENVQAPPGANPLRDEDDQAAIDAAANIKSGAASPEKCEEEKKVLAETYVKTYVQLSRLKDEYHTLANSTACVDNVESLYNSRKTPLQAAIDRLIKEIDTKVRALQGLRPRLESATEAESALRKHIATLTEECSALPETLSDLDKVRDAIEALNKCPGLSRVEFSIPRWIGTWVSLDLKAKEMTDEEQDKAMNAACDEAAAGTRAAEVSEISMRTVEGLPETNTAKYPLIATCPNCIGDATMDLPSKHKRICWSPGHDLECKAKSTNCASGRKAVLCVTDRKNIRQIPRLQEDEEDAPVEA